MSNVQASSESATPVANIRSSTSGETCAALLTLARARARADAVRDRSMRNSANDNDPRCDLRPL